MYIKRPYFNNGDDDTGHGNAPPPGGRSAPAPNPVPTPPVKPAEDDKK